MLNLEGRLVLVAGGGRVALRKTRGFLEAGAVVRLVAPALTQELANLAQAGEIEWLAREYDTLDLEGCWLAVAATDSRETNQRIGEEADQAGIWVNVVDRPEICGFSVPAHFRQGELTVSVSHGRGQPHAGGPDQERPGLPLRPLLGRLLPAPLRAPDQGSRRGARLGREQKSLRGRLGGRPALAA